MKKTIKNLQKQINAFSSELDDLRNYFTIDLYFTTEQDINLNDIYNWVTEESNDLISNLNKLIEKIESLLKETHTDYDKRYSDEEADLIYECMSHLDESKELLKLIDVYISTKLQEADINFFDELMNLNPRKNMTDENYLKSLFICNLYNFTTSQLVKLRKSLVSMVDELTQL